MKKIIIAFTLLLCSSLTFAEWKTSVEKYATFLTGKVKSIARLTWEAPNGCVYFYSDKKTIYLQCYEGILDRNYYNDYYVNVDVSLRDLEGNEFKRYNCASMRMGNKDLNTAYFYDCTIQKKAIKHILKGTGYVIFSAERYNDDNLIIIVPCRNNPERK